MLLLLACSTTAGGDNLGSGGDRYEFDSTIWGTTTETGTTTTTETGTTGGTTLTSEPVLDSPSLSWETDVDELMYLLIDLPYWDNPDDVLGGSLYIDLYEDGVESWTGVYDLVDPESWSPQDDEARDDMDSMLLTAWVYDADPSVAYDLTLTVKDSSGNLSDPVEGSVDAAE